VTVCLLVVRQPVEQALTNHRHDNLDRVRLAYVSAQDIVRVLDRADNKNVTPHGDNVPGAVAMSSSVGGALTGEG
jgi:hypothetical protein